MKKEKRLPSMLASTLKDTVKNIQRNNLMSFASIVSLVAALIILGALIIISININNIANTMVKSLELKVYLENQATDEDRAQIEEIFNSNENITNYTFESKEEALRIYSDRLDQYAGLLEGFENNNPVSDSYTVEVNRPENLEEVNEYIQEEGSQIVKNTRYGEEYVDTIVLFEHFSNIFCLLLLVILSIISIIVIYNTIKLTCYSSRKEIEIMRFVGADNWYIKLPFFLEGVTLGVIGAFFACLILLVLYMYLLGLSGTLTHLPLNAQFVSPRGVIIPIVIFTFIYSIIMASFGSLFSIRRYFLY